METRPEPQKHTCTRRPLGGEQESHDRGGTEPNATGLKPLTYQLDHILPSSIHPTLQWGKETVGGGSSRGVEATAEPARGLRAGGARTADIIHLNFLPPRT